MTIETIECNSTSRSNPYWTAWGVFDGLKVRLTLWGEHMGMLMRAGYPAAKWQVEGATNIKVDVIVGKDKRGANSIASVPDRDDDHIQVKSGDMLEVGDIVAGDRRVYGEPLKGACKVVNFEEEFANGVTGKILRYTIIEDLETGKRTRFRPDKDRRFYIVKSAVQV